MRRWIPSLIVFGTFACRPGATSPASANVPESQTVVADRVEGPSSEGVSPAAALGRDEPKAELIVPPPETYFWNETNPPDDNWYVADNCPGDEPCMFSLDYAVFITKKGMDQVFILDYGEPDRSLRKGRPLPPIWWARLEYGARAIFEGIPAPRVRGSCGLVSRVPKLYGASPDGILVPVPPARKRSPAPEALTPDAANAKIAAAFSRFAQGAPRLHEEPADAKPPLLAFPEAEAAKMTEDTLEDVRVRHFDAWRSGGTRGSQRESLVSVDVIYSPTSRRVYVIDGSYYEELEDSKGLRKIAKLKRAREQALARTLQSLELSEVRFALASACDIPKAFGDYTWFDLQLDQSETDRAALRDTIAQAHQLGEAKAAKERKENPRTPVHHVIQGKATSTPGLDPDIIDRIVDSHINELRHCYALAVARDPHIRGEIVTNFEISPDGHSRAIGIEEPFPGDAALKACVLKAFDRWVFPKPDGNVTVQVRYPVSFEPNEAE